MHKQLKLWLTSAESLAPDAVHAEADYLLTKPHPILHLYQAETENFPFGHRTRLFTSLKFQSSEFLGSYLSLHSGRV